MARPLPGEPDQPSQKPIICVQAQTSRHHRVAVKVTTEKPKARRNIQLADDVTLPEFAAVDTDLGDAVHHQHRRRRQLRVAWAEMAAIA